MTTHRFARLHGALAAAVLLLGVAAAAHADEKSESILEPKDGATVTSPFKVRFAAHGMTVHPATEVIEGTGHHHLLINHGPIEKGEAIPMDDTHLHYGKGQTEAEITLPPGKYRLTAQFADGAHRSYGRMMADSINITVK